MIKLKTETRTALLGPNDSVVPYAEEGGRWVYKIEFRVDGVTPVHEGKFLRLSLRLPHTKSSFDYELRASQLSKYFVGNPEALRGETLGILVVEENCRYRIVGIAKQRKWS